MTAFNAVVEIDRDGSVEPDELLRLMPRLIRPPDLEMAASATPRRKLAPSPKRNAS